MDTKYISEIFNIGDIFAVSGKASLSKYGNLQFTHPDFDRITEDESFSFLNTGKIIPFYRIPKELKSTNLGDLSLRKILNNTVEMYVEALDESIPKTILEDYKLLNIVEAVRNFHFPENQEKLTLAVKAI